MAVKFSMEEGIEDGGSSMPNFIPIGATWSPCGSRNLKIDL